MTRKSLNYILERAHPVVVLVEATYKTMGPEARAMSSRLIQEARLAECGARGRENANLHHRAAVVLLRALRPLVPPPYQDLLDRAIEHHEKKEPGPGRKPLGATKLLERVRRPADELTKELRGMDLAEIYPLAAERLGVPEEALRAAYGHMNPGMQRMNLGNRIRRKEKATK